LLNNQLLNYQLLNYQLQDRLAMRLLSLLCLLTLLATDIDVSAAQTESLPVRITQQTSGVKEASFRGLAVRNKNEAWVSGSQGTIMRTTDAGQTWVRCELPGLELLDFRDVEVLKDGSVLAMSIGNGDASRIIRSSDSGKSWKTVLTNADPDGFFDGMTFGSDDKTGVLFGDPINGRIDLYRTRDAGQTWQRVAEARRPELQKGEYAFAASGTGVVLIGKNIWIATGGSTARIHHSPDDGHTWNVYDTPIRSGNESSGIFSVEFLDANNGVAIGGDYLKPSLDSKNVATSIDGGKTWKLSPAVLMPHKACVRSLGHNRLLTCGRTGVAFSANGGQAWTTVSPAGYFTLAVDRQSGTGFLAGKDGRIARFELSKK
jgi:photosystem II stability/assembly factor-like uncharacterized protein